MYFENQIPLADVVDLTDMWVIQCRDGAGLLIEAVTVGGHQPLDRDDAVEAGVASLPHLAHPAGAEWRHQRVGTELNASSPIGHCFEILAKVLLGPSPDSSSAMSGSGGCACSQRRPLAFSS